MVGRVLGTSVLTRDAPARAIGRSLSSAPAGASTPSQGGAAVRPSPPVTVSTPEPRMTLAEAEKLAAERVAQALQHASEEAADKAYQEGFADGAKSVESQQQLVIKKLQDAISQSHSKLEEKLATLEQLALQLVQTMMERVLGADTNRAFVLQQIVQHQMSQLANGSVLRLRLSEQTLRDNPELDARLRDQHADQVQVLADHNLPKGGCVIDLNLGQIDAGIETQLGLLQQQFLHMMEPPRND